MITAQRLQRLRLEFYRGATTTPTSERVSILIKVRFLEQADTAFCIILKFPYYDNTLPFRGRVRVHTFLKTIRELSNQSPLTHRSNNACEQGACGSQD